MRRDLQISLLLILAVVGVYWPVCSFDYVQLDDHQYVFANRDGFTARNMTHAMTGVTEGNWHPLTMLSHMLDCQLFGVSRPGMHHLVNLLLHVANTLLVFRLFRVMTGALWPSAVVAALFGLHPQHVESVAWISERKDLLSTFFFLLMLLAYYGYARRPSLLRYLGVFGLLLLGLLSKPMLVTAPFVALLLDFWPLGRWRPLPSAAAGGLKIYDESCEGNEGEHNDALEDATALLSETPQLPPRSLAALIVEKLPLVALSLVFSVIAYRVQQASGAMNMLGDNLAWYVRLGNSLTAYGNYLSKTVYPEPLAAIYPYTMPSLVNSLTLGVSLLALLIASLRMARERPYLIVGLLWFLGTLVPVIGIVQIGTQSMADRYTYIPLIGVFIIIAWGGREFIAPWTAAQRTASTLIMLAILSVVSFVQVGHWRDSEALFRHAAAVPKNSVAHYALGKTLWQKDRLEEAADEFSEALKYQKAEPVYRNLGLVLAIRGRHADARDALLDAIKLQPSQPEPYRHLAWLLATAPEKAIRDGQKAIGLAQRAIDCDKNGDALDNALNRDALAAAYAESGDFAAAVTSARAAAEAAQAANDPGLAAEITARCQLYQNHRPYHESLKTPRRI